jgi:hypothetical protein
MSFKSLRAANLNSRGVSGVGLAVGVGLSLGETVASGVGETEGVASLVEVLESVAEETIPETTNTVTIVAFCQGFKDKNFPHNFLNTLASANLNKITN